MIFKISLDGKILDYEINSAEQKKLVQGFLRSNKDLKGLNISNIFERNPKFYNEVNELIKNTINTEQVLSQRFYYKVKSNVIV